MGGDSEDGRRRQRALESRGEQRGAARAGQSQNGKKLDHIGSDEDGKIEPEKTSRSASNRQNGCLQMISD